MNELENAPTTRLVQLFLERALLHDSQRYMAFGDLDRELLLEDVYADLTACSECDSWEALQTAVKKIPEIFWSRLERWAEEYLEQDAAPNLPIAGGGAGRSPYW